MVPAAVQLARGGVAEQRAAEIAQFVREHEASAPCIAVDNLDMRRWLDKGTVHMVLVDAQDGLSTLSDAAMLAARHHMGFGCDDGSTSASGGSGDDTDSASDSGTACTTSSDVQRIEECFMEYESGWYRYFMMTEVCDSAPLHAAGHSDGTVHRAAGDSDSWSWSLGFEAMGE